MPVENPIQGDETLREMQRTDEFRYIVMAGRIGMHPKPTITQQTTLDKFIEMKMVPHANFETIKRRIKFRVSQNQDGTYRVRNGNCQHHHPTYRKAIKCGIRHSYCQDKKDVGKGKAITLLTEKNAKIRRV